MKVIGIDPGRSGAAVVYDGTTTALIRLSETERDIWDFIDQHSSGELPRALLERVHSMPGQGVASSFRFGECYGFLRGCLIAAGVPFRTITPQKWQRRLGCLSRGDKNVTKAKAQELFPDLKITHAIADALLIAYHEYHYPEGS
jgi:crossover junction endodeoxyribonuclease RuvC